jgi:hypothetical protein
MISKGKNVPIKLNQCLVTHIFAKFALLTHIFAEVADLCVK